jgi:TetR/AcrR family transcriptional regulator, tetracycline repressor protein
VVSAALDVIDTQGLAAATTRAVASRLGIAAQSLYTHIESRDDLLDAVVETIVDELDDDPDLVTIGDAEWEPYLVALAHAVRRYAQSHPRAFPLVATRPARYPWVNPPLRSLRWIERFLARLRAGGFTDDQVLFTYRSFNAFLLGFLLLETGSMTSDSPKPGDGAYSSRGARAPVPGAPSPTRSRRQETVQRRASTTTGRLDPFDGLDAETYPTVSALADGLVENPFDAEFDAGLANLLKRVTAELSTSRSRSGRRARATR